MLINGAECMESVLLRLNIKKMLRKFNKGKHKRLNNSDVYTF